MNPDSSDAPLVQAALQGDLSSFESLISQHSPRLFATARRHTRSEADAQDVVQEIWIKAHQKLATYRGDAPFEHWLMTLAVRTCYDYLRKQRRARETPFADLTDNESEWLDRFARAPETASEAEDAARSLLSRVMEQLSPAEHMIITLLEIENRPIKEIAQLTGWSLPLVKIRAFRARARMRKILGTLNKDKYL